MPDKFHIAAQADSKLRKFREAETKAQTLQSIFAIAAGLALLAVIYASSLAVQRWSVCCPELFRLPKSLRHTLFWERANLHWTKVLRRPAGVLQVLRLARMDQCTYASCSHLRNEGLIHTYAERSKAAPLPASSVSRLTLLRDASRKFGRGDGGSPRS